MNSDRDMGNSKKSPSSWAEWVEIGGVWPALESTGVSVLVGGVG